MRPSIIVVLGEKKKITTRQKNVRGVIEGEKKREDFPLPEKKKRLRFPK